MQGVHARACHAHHLPLARGAVDDLLAHARARPVERRPPEDTSERQVGLYLLDDPLGQRRGHEGRRRRVGQRPAQRRPRRREVRILEEQVGLMHARGRTH